MCTVAFNNELNGIEISFDSKPNQAIITDLKSNGFRWHNVKKLWYARQTEERKVFAEKLNAGKVICAVNASEVKPKKNKFGVKVGDIFSASWGYDQTNNDFFQVIALVGDSSVRVREVAPHIERSTPVSGMSEDREMKIDSSVLLPASPFSVFIKDQEKGDLKRLKSYAKDGVSNPQFCLSSFCDAHYCADGIHTFYESWYA